MKMLLSQRERQRAADHGFGATNDALRLAAELLERGDDLPIVDISAAAIQHWNGQKIAVEPSEIMEMVDSGLIDGEGNWTDYGRSFMFEAAQSRAL